MLITSGLGKWRQAVQWLANLANLAYLVSSKPLRDPVSKNKVDRAWGMIPEVDLCPLHAHAHIHTKLCKDTHMEEGGQRQREIAKERKREEVRRQLVCPSSRVCIYSLPVNRPR